MRVGAGGHRPGSVRKNNTCHLRSPHIPSHSAILHRHPLRAPQSVQAAPDDAPGLLHRARHTVVGRHDSRNAASGNEDGSERRRGRFVVPLCATIHMSGSTMKIVCCAIALMLMQGLPFDLPMFARGSSACSAYRSSQPPAYQGGAIMASLGILASMLGFSETDQALMIALYIAMDSFGTACNVTGDGFIAPHRRPHLPTQGQRRRYRLLNMRPVKPSHLQTVHSSQTAPYRARFIRRIMPEQQSPRIMTAKNFLGDVFANFAADNR